MLGRHDATFTIPEAAKLVGVKYARLDRWIRQDRVLGSRTPLGHGQGRPRRISWGDVVYLRSLTRLLHAGISYRTIRNALREARAYPGLATGEHLALLAVGASVCVVGSHAEIIEILRGGQLVMAAAFTEDVVAELDRLRGAHRARGIERSNVG